MPNLDFSDILAGQSGKQTLTLLALALLVMALKEDDGNEQQDEKGTFGQDPTTMEEPEMRVVPRFAPLP